MMPCAGLPGASWRCPCSGTFGGPVRQAEVASKLGPPVNQALQVSIAKAAGSGLGAARKRGRARLCASTARSPLQESDGSRDPSSRRWKALEMTEI